MALRIERAVVVGASGGIGAALAKALGDDGAVVHALSRRGLAAAEKLFSADIAARHLLNVMAGVSASVSGGIFAWDGAAITP